MLKQQILPLTLVYLLFIFLLQLTNGWYQNFSDAVHYLWVADRYAEGDWPNAINTYWGPMTSWLLLLLKPLIAEPFVRFRILQLLLGFTALLLINVFLRKKITEGNYALLFTLVAVPLIVSFAWFYLTPDLLLLNGVLVTLLFFSKEREINLKQAFLTALAGALLFYIKSAGLLLFVVLIIGKFVLERKQWNLPHFLQNCRIAFFLLLLCSPWFALMSWKHGSFTTGTSSGHNFKMNSPRITPDMYGEIGNPYHLGTLTEPDPPDAFDACVEHAHQPYLSWEGMSRGEIFSYYLKIVVRNLKSARSMFFGIDIGTVFLLLLLTAFFLDRMRAKTFLHQNTTLLLIFVGNVCIYLLFFFMDRYTWPGLIALFFLGTGLLFYLPAFRKSALIITTATVFLSLHLYTLYKEYQYSLPEKPITEEIWKSERQLKLKRTMWLCDKDDKRLGLVKGLIYYNNGQYLGALFYQGNSGKTIAEQVAAHNISTIITLDAFPDSLLPKEQYVIRQTLKSPVINTFALEKKQ